MEAEYDFSQGKRGAIEPKPSGQTRITIPIDDDILDWFWRSVHLSEGGNYQGLISDRVKFILIRWESSALR